MKSMLANSRHLPKHQGFILYNALSFQAVWWSSVLWLNLSLLLTIPLLLLHFILLSSSGKGQYRQVDLRLMLKVAALGIGIDTVLSVLGLFEFPALPWWLGCLWLHFGLSLNHSLAFMRPLPLILQALLGGIFGTLSYVAGAQFNAVILPCGNVISAVVLFFVWLVLLPFLIQLANPYGFNRSTKARTFTVFNFSSLSLLALGLLIAPLKPLEAKTSNFENINIELNDAADVTQTFQEVGRGEMDWLWFSLYKARLMTVNGRYQQGQYPLLLDIEYYRDIESEDLLEATKDQWQHLAFAENDIQRWFSLLTATWPDVKQGDHLSFKVMDGQTSQFFFNHQPLEIIQDADFAEAFLAIWLSKDTSRPSLRAQLLGEKPCDC
ncbi:DUF2878 family protein [Shewanella sp. SP2S2-6]|nr:DUF2878 family protein [Shewanella sp. SP2S2-6]